MTDYTVSKAIDLDLIPARDDLIIIVSDPAIPEGPEKRSKKIVAGSLRPTTITWDVVLVPNVSDIPDIKSGDFLVVGNADSGVDIAGSVVYTGDTLIVLTLTPDVMLMLIPKQTARARTVLDLAASTEPVIVKPNTSIYTDVSSGTITLALEEGAINDEYIDIINVAGQYSVNNLIITSASPIHGVIDSVTVDLDGISLQLRWKDATSGWIIISR